MREREREQERERKAAGDNSIFGGVAGRVRSDRGDLGNCLLLRLRSSDAGYTEKHACRKNIKETAAQCHLEPKVIQLVQFCFNWSFSLVYWKHDYYFFPSVYLSVYLFVVSAVFCGSR